jgi:hypothetical protein
MKLYEMVKAKTGYISDKLYKEALVEAKKDIKSHKEMCPEWEFDKWTKEERLQYVAFVMACWIIMSGRYE